MAELEIDREDVHDRKKWRLEVMKRKSNPIGKRDYKLIIIIYNWELGRNEAGLTTIYLVKFGTCIQKLKSN